jgi:hypothetical protein
MTIDPSLLLEPGKSSVWVSLYNPHQKHSVGSKSPSPSPKGDIGRGIRIVFCWLWCFR